jgi:TDG/mug DNA glycosylase family protein
LPLPSNGRGDLAPRAVLLPPLRDRIAPGLKVLFVGINPGIRSAQTGHHFAGYSNRFWKLLHGSGLVPEPITFEQDDRLPEWGYGITNIVARPTPGVGDLHPSELVAGKRALVRKVRRFRPEIVAVAGVTIYRALFPSARGPIRLGMSRERLAGARVFLLPNPSGRNAHYTYAEMLEAFRALGAYVGRIPRHRQSPRTRRSP